MAQLSPPSGSVDASGVVELGGYALEASLVDDDPAPDAPNPDDHQARIDPARVIEPVRSLDPDQAEQPIEPACVRVEHLCPDQHPGHEGDHVGQEEEDAEQAGRAQRSAVKEKRDREGQDHGNRERDGRELERDQKRIPDLRVAQQRGVVIEPHEAQRLFLVELDVQEGEDQRRDDGDEREGQEADDPRRQEEQARTCFVPRQA